MIERPIFIIGTERSGSNLMRLLLNTHPRLAVPHPPHVVRYFKPLERGYGDLLADDPFRRFVTDILNFLAVHIHPWAIPIDVATIMKLAPSRTSFGVCVALYEQYRTYVRKPRWACKSTFMIDDTGTVLSHFPRAQFVFLVRDPRDVAVSSRSSIFSTFHPYYTALLWQRQQLEGIRLLETLSSDRILLVRYEDLLEEPEKQLRRICEFIGEDFVPAMLRYFETEEAARSAALARCWANISKPLLQNNSGKFLQELSAEDIKIVESTAREPMLRLGYPLVSPATTLREASYRRHNIARFWLAEQWLRARAEIRSGATDRNFRRRWRRGALATYLHFRRSLLPRLVGVRWQHF